MAKKIIKKYIIRKYVFAYSPIEALKKEKNFLADEIWLDEEWKKSNDEVEKKSLGF